MNRQENIPIDYNGKQYTKYEALQRQRQLETRMRAERQKIKLLQDGEADETDIMLARAKYRGTSQEYTSFSKAMDLPQQITYRKVGIYSKLSFLHITNKPFQF